MKTRQWVTALGVVLSAQAAWAGNDVTAMAVARDGKSVVVASAARSVRVLALPDGRALKALALTEVPQAVALSPSGKTLAVGGFGFLDLYDPATGKQLAHVSDPLGHLSVKSLAFSPDGKSLAAAGDAGRVKLFDGASAKELREVKGLAKAVNAVAFAPDGKTLAVAGMDQAVSLFGAADAAPGPVLKAHKTWIAALIFSVDGKHLFSLDDKGNVVLWDRAGQKPLGELKADWGWTYALAASPDGKTLAWGAEEGVQLYDLVGHKPAAKLPLDRSQINALAYTPDGKRLVAGDYAGHVHLVDVAAGTQTLLP